MPTDAGHILISLEPRHAENILAGRKQVELRKRVMKIVPGTTVWIYVKLPVGCIVGSARIGATDASSPSALWRRYGSVSGLTKREFFEYFDGSQLGIALTLEGSSRLRNYISLDALRELCESFQPPQFFARLSADHPIHDAVISSA